MNKNKPEFHLAAVYQDGTRGEPQVIPVTAMPWKTSMDRRGALGAGLGLAGVLAALQSRAAAEGCAVPRGESNAHSKGIYAFAATADSKVLVSGGADNTIRIWSLQDGRLVAALRAHDDRVRCLAVTPNRQVIASGSLDKTVKLWSLPEAKLLTTIKAHQEAVNALVVTPDGKTLITGSSDLGVKLWSLSDTLSDTKILTTLEGHKTPILALVVTPNGKILASGSEDGISKLWSLPDGNLLKSLEGHKDWVGGLAVTPDGNILASASFDNTIKLWSLPGGELLTTIEGHKNPVNAVVVTPDGKILITGSWDNTIKLWSLPDGKLLATLEGHKESVWALAMVPDGKTLASGDSGGMAILWNPEFLQGIEPCFRTYLSDQETTQSGKPAHTGGPDVSAPEVPPTYVPPPYVPPPYVAPPVCACNKVCTCVPISSRRWKTNILPLGGALAQIERLRAVRFDWEAGAPQGRAGPDLGFIAEEVAPIIPEVVAFDEHRKPLGVDYARLTVLLVEAVQNQQKQIEELQGEISRLLVQLSPVAAND